MADPDDPVSPCRRLGKLVSSGDREGVSTLVAELLKTLGPDAAKRQLTTSDFGGRGTQSALHRAATSGNVGILRTLLEAGADPMAPDDAGNTPMHHACQQGHARACYVLLEAGARADFRNSFGTVARTNLKVNNWDSEAIKTGKEAVLKMLDAGLAATPFNDLPPEPERKERPAPQEPPQEPPQRSGGGPGGGPYSMAALGLEMPWLSSPTVPRVSTSSIGGWSAASGYSGSTTSTVASTADLERHALANLSIRELVKKGYEEAVKQRLDEALASGGKGLAIREATNCEDDGKDTRIVQSPLHVAARMGTVSMLRLLLDTGATPDLCNDSGDSLLHVAACAGRDDIVEELMQAGANPTAMNNFGRTPIEHAEAQPWDSEEVAKRKANCRHSMTSMTGIPGVASAHRQAVARRKPLLT